MDCLIIRKFRREIAVDNAVRRLLHYIYDHTLVYLHVLPGKSRDFLRTLGLVRIDELAAFVSSGLRSTGRTTFDTVSLAEYAESEQPPRISMYACVDVSGTRLINSAGVDVTPADRDSRVPVLLSFEGGPGSVLVSGSQLWSGDNFC